MAISCADTLHTGYFHRAARAAALLLPSDKYPPPQKSVKTTPLTVILILFSADTPHK